MKIFLSLLNPMLVILVLMVLLFLNSFIFKKISLRTSKFEITKNIVSFFLIFFSVLFFVLLLPIDSSSKSQIFTLLSIVISAGIALSSTSLLGNLMAGIMNNSMNNFRSGTLVKIGEIQGRIIKKGMFYTEIQLEDSNFVNIPNLYISKNPVKLIRKSNIVISSSVSLGYEVAHEKIENALKEAAILTGLKNPYVYITSLGDFSVVYKIHGFLDDNTKFFSTKAKLNANVMDKLHENKIEIVSPNFMNQRRVDDEEFIPRKKNNLNTKSLEKTPEKMIFDEAIKSENLEVKKDYLKEIDKKIEKLKEKLKHSKDSEEKKNLEYLLDRNSKLKEQIENRIKEQIKNNENSLL